MIVNNKNKIQITKTVLKIEIIADFVYLTEAWIHFCYKTKTNLQQEEHNKNYLDPSNASLLTVVDTTFPHES